MPCPKCGAYNREPARFCDRCGAHLPTQCDSCGTRARPGARFCDSCGAHLQCAPGTGADTPSARITSAGERRHLTVLFCDLVGSTETAARLDPEEWGEVLAAYHGAAADAISRFGGHVAKYLGDGVMAYFGWPEAHENDAERAARAGLAILDVVLKLNRESTPQLVARVGIDSGAVVVAADADKDADVFGEPPNIAARLQGTAVPGTVLITAATHRLISGLFVVEALGPRALKGIAAPLEVFQVVRPTAVRRRLQAARVLTPFVGREEELRLLLSGWERTREGEGQVTLIMGEPGIGKSRLVTEFHDRIRDAPHIWMESAGDQFFENTPFHPVTEMFSEWLELQDCPDNEGQLERVERALALAGLKVAEVAPLIADLLQLPAGERYPASSLTAEQKRRRLLAALSQWIVGAARLQPLVIVVEDLHWLDPSTLELQQLLAGQGTTARLLLLYTARPKLHSEWPLGAHHTQITLNRLSPCNVREMIAQVMPRNALPAETVSALIERTSGVPLFVEELTRAVLESGNAKVSEREIPVTLHDSLMARLDRLGVAKEILQIGATIGSEFSYELLRAVHAGEDEDLQQTLRALADAELLYERGTPPNATYQFKHALIRDAAYGALLKNRRKNLHRLIAQTISQKFQALNMAQPEVLARHWAEAGETEQAIAEWSRAGKLARARGAFKEALDCFRQGLAMLELLPESSERDLRELAFRESFLLMLWMTRGPSSHDTMEAVQRAVRLAEKTAKLASLVQIVVAGGWNLVAASPDVAAIQKLADQALEIAHHEGGPASLLMAHSLQLQTCLFRGDLAGAENHFEATTRLVDDSSIKQKYNLFVVQGSYTAAMNAWVLGRLDLARERFAKLVATTDANNPYQLAASLVWAADFLCALRNYERAEASAMQALELAEKNQFALVAATSKRILGSSRVGLGRANEGVELIREAIADAVEIGCAQRGFFNKTFVAVAQAGEGAIDDALETIEQALGDNSDEAFFLPTTLALRGDLRIKQGQNQLAEADFREALERARCMGAKMLELQAAMSLARLLDQQQRRNEARELLAEIYNWFTEGFDTADLKEAKALLDELRR